jgi:hypothetical protein
MFSHAGKNTKQAKRVATTPLRASGVFSFDAFIEPFSNDGIGIWFLSEAA